MKRIDLNLLQVFDAVMAERSVTRAAIRLALSQPAVSNALSRLRRQVGDPLFIRNGRSIMPTPRALHLIGHVSAALRQVDEAFGRPAFDPKRSHRTFRIGTTDDMEMLLIPRLIRQLSSAAPGVTLACQRLRGLWEIPREELQAGTLDFAIGMFPLPHPDESGLFALPLYDGEFVCIARRQHPSIRKTSLTLRQFLKLHHVVVNYPGEGPGLIDRILFEAGKSRRIDVSVAHWLSAPFIVAASDLIATIPEPVYRAVRRSLPLQQFPCPVSLPPLHVSLTWHTRSHEDPGSRWFRAFSAAVVKTVVEG
jgi:DNA-binding transcriptional LysR family regulator